MCTQNYASKPKRPAMTDDNLNRAVARIIDETHGAPATNEPRNVPAYCTNPAAWGALLDWLAGENRGPVLMANFPGVTDWRAEVWAEDDNNRHEAIDILPGRALVLATLKAWGVEVEDD